MSEKKTLIERRAASDKRIIEAAIKSFGHLGYTYSSIRDIAKSAGITSGLITQRYGTKENLFLKAYEAALEGAFSEVEITASPRECLVSIISDIEKLCDNDPDVFEFCSMLHNGQDYPKEILRPNQEQLKKSNSYKILKTAQKNGMLPKGNLDVLLAALGAMVFDNTKICKRFNIKYPEPDKYLEFINFCDKITASREKWHQVINAAMANTFDVLIYINIPGNKGEVLQREESFEVSGDFINARADIESTIQKYYLEDEQEKLREYMNLDNLGERLKGRKSVSHKSMRKDGSIYMHSILPVNWDEDGNLIEIFVGVYQQPQY